ncbi:hypothetical protein LguiB_032007 [Lonicera macranthoides]
MMNNAYSWLFNSRMLKMGKFNYYLSYKSKISFPHPYWALYAHPVLNKNSRFKYFRFGMQLERGRHYLKLVLEDVNVV